MELTSKRQFDPQGIPIGKVTSSDPFPFGDELVRTPSDAVAIALGADPEDNYWVLADGSLQPIVQTSSAAPSARRSSNA